jgi:hypothetical protein
MYMNTIDSTPGKTLGAGIGKRNNVNKAPIPNPTPEEKISSFITFLIDK